MKLATKSAGLCASGAVILTIYTALFNHLDPMNILFIALPGSVLAGVLGHQIGMILASPQGAATKASKKGRAAAQLKPSRPITGNETFLDDLETSPVPAPELELFDTSAPSQVTASAAMEEEPGA